MEAGLVLSDQGPTKGSDERTLCQQSFWKPGRVGGIVDRQRVKVQEGRVRHPPIEHAVDLPQMGCRLSTKNVFATSGGASLDLLQRRKASYAAGHLMDLWESQRTMPKSRVFWFKAGSQVIQAAVTSAPNLLPLRLRWACRSW